MRNRCGFSIVEIVIVLAVLVLFAGLSMAGFRYFGQTRQLDGEARKVVSMLELAKKKASAGEKLCTGFDGIYKVEWGGSNYSIKTAGGCGFGNTQVKLANGLAFDAGDAVIFKPFGLGVEVAKVITIRNTAGATKIIDIDINGNISMN